ncbi:myb-like protein Q [Uranotaenia lowii]|uniref:myb-like protein Q n=1 Tax=Uranotaenia lowii TaxID=190385 RepID=UPI00247921F5|nr:myb-like protein Q [Uranotaenia lowii]
MSRISIDDFRKRFSNVPVLRKKMQKECQNLIEENRRLVNLAANGGYAMNGSMLMNGSNNNGAAGFVGVGSSLGGGSSSGASSLTTTLGLGLAGGGGGVSNGVGNGAGYSNVESVILQTQVETLQWQLKQVDSSRQMYRAVMEEVARYLERCYRTLDALQPTIIGRSKSVLQVSKSTMNHDSDSSSASASPRARSSTNLIDVQKSYTKKQQELLLHQQHQQQQQNKHHHHHQSHLQLHHKISPLVVGSSSLILDEDCAPPSPAGSYSTFRDFTWRRSPKRLQTLPISASAEVDPEKLAQEAFRLLRTVQNLLNTQEPSLCPSSSQTSSSQPQSQSQVSNNSSSMANAALDGLLSAAGGSVTGSTSTLVGVGAVGGPGGEVYNTRSNVGFIRKINMRGSRLSLRSSTDDSVHSTSSSNKTETDEDNTDRPSPPPGGHHLLVGHHQHQNSGSSSSSSTSSNSGHLVNHRHSANIERIKEMMISSSAEDESGFSSMNSFQEIGLPLVNSTMLSSSSAASSTTGVCSADSNSSAASSTGSVSLVSDESSELRENTVVQKKIGNGTSNAISHDSSENSSSPAKHGSQLSDKLGTPSAAKQSDIPSRVTQSPAYEHHSHFVNHRRWDSAPVVPSKLKIHGDSSSDGGVSSRVLWV